MKKHNNTVDLLLTLADFQKNILAKKPSVDRMLDEVRMMHFKVRPLQGDISMLNLKENQLVESLWNLGKLDEFFKKHQEKLTQDQKDVFFRFFDELHDRFQNQLNKINLRSQREQDFSATIEMEIFKEDASKPN